MPRHRCCRAQGRQYIRVDLNEEGATKPCHYVEVVELTGPHDGFGRFNITSTAFN